MAGPLYCMGFVIFNSGWLLQQADMKIWQSDLQPWLAINWGFLAWAADCN